MTTKMTACEALVAYRAALAENDEAKLGDLEAVEISDRVAVGFTARNGAQFPLAPNDPTMVTLGDMLFEDNPDADEYTLASVDAMIAKLAG